MNAWLVKRFGLHHHFWSVLRCHSCNSIVWDKAFYQPRRMCRRCWKDGPICQVCHRNRVGNKNVRWVTRNYRTALACQDCYDKDIESGPPPIKSRPPSVFNNEELERIARMMRDRGVFESRARDYTPGPRDDILADAADDEMTQLQLKNQSIERDHTP